jgi:hypothetical protein
MCVAGARRCHLATQWRASTLTFQLALARPLRELLAMKSTRALATAQPYPGPPETPNPMPDPPPEEPQVPPDPVPLPHPVEPGLPTYEDVPPVKPMDVSGARYAA